MKMNLYLNSVCVFGYDEHGGVRYKKEVSGDHHLIAQVLKESFSVNEVVKVTIELSDDNWRIYDEKGKELK